MGNQLLKEYTIGENPVASGGPGFLWKIFNGVHKNTREDVSIFICNIKDIEQRFGAKNVENVIARFRHESAILSKLRHPLILHPVQPLLETKTEIAMVTEPVLGSVSNILLKQYQGIPQEQVATSMKEFDLLDFEVS
jgi:SCY1-like protein 2